MVRFPLVIGARTEYLYSRSPAKTAIGTNTNRTRTERILLEKHISDLQRVGYLPMENARQCLSCKEIARIPANGSSGANRRSSDAVRSGGNGLRPPVRTLPSRPLRTEPEGLRCHPALHR